MTASEWRKRICEIAASGIYDLEAAEKRSDMYADLCRGVAEAIGVPEEGEGSSWHDLPEKVKIAVLSSAREPELRWYPWGELLRDAMKLLDVPGMWNAPVDEQWRESYAELRERYGAVPAAPDSLRESVRWFAGEMERQLRENDGKCGWQDCGRTWLVGQARGNLSEVLRLDFSEKDAIVKAAADAANFCLMIADNRTWPRAALAPRKEGEG